MTFHPLRLCAALLLALSLLCAAGAHAAPARSLRFEQLSVEHGLAQESILAIIQDGDGFMWFGSQSGLSRFDGYRVTTYRNEAGNPASLVNNWVRVLHIDSVGRLWIGTDGGLDRFDPETQTFTHYDPQEPVKRGNGNRHIHALLDDGKDGLWIATADGLQHFDMKTGAFKVWRHVAGMPQSLADDKVNALALDAGGRLWIGTDSGLDSLAPGARGFEHHAVAGGGAKLNTVSALLADANQTLWIGSLDGLEMWKPSAGPAARRLLGPAEGVARSKVTVLFQDADATIWAGTHDDGLYRWLPQLRRFANYRSQPGDGHSLADNYVSSMFRDRLGTFWVGTWYAGVSRVDLGSGGFTRIVRQAGGQGALSDNKVRAIVGDGAGKVWLGTNDGIDRYDPVTATTEVWRHDPDNPNSLSDALVNALALDRNGVLWAGGRSGVTSFDPAKGRFTRQLLAAGDPAGETVRGMLADRAGVLWISSLGGLHRLDPATRKVRTYQHHPADPDSLADNVARTILEDRRGQLWIGTFDGLDLLDRATGKFRHFRHDPADPASINHDEVHYLLEDHRGDIWVGTAGGLNKMIQDRGGVKFKRYSSADGLADDAVAAMLEDDDGNIWVSSTTGLSRLNPATGKWRTYNGADGTIEGAYFDGSAFKSRDGTLYFGGFNGITAFHPRAISDNLIAPRAVITGFQVFNKPVQQVHPGLLKGPIEHASEITLDAADSVFSLEFSALHYAAPQRNRFAYQLVGFDENWVATDASRRFATYTNLDPGTYTFKVKAANKDGVWSASGATLSIVIRPPFWKTWWFRTMMGMFVLGSAYAAFRFRMRGLRRQKDLLEQQVHARTAEIGQQNRLLERQKLELDMRRVEAESQRAEAEQRRRDAERQKEEVELQKENVELAHRNISILSEIGRELTATLDMETIMDTVYRHVQHLMDARIFGIGIYREDLGVIEFPFAIDQGMRSPRYTRPVDQPNQLAVWCLTHRREVFINDIEAEYDNYIEHPAPGPLAHVPRADGSASSVAMSTMYVPLIVKERVMGVLCVQSIEKNAYRRVHLDMLQTLAAHAAVALDNARAYRQLEEMEKRVRLNTDELAQANRALQDNDERLRLAKQRAEDATRQKSEFLANMSHEMRTPLAGVIGMLGFALRDARLHDGTREQILRGQANAQALLAIINDLLDFSKIEAGKLTIENIDFALSATLEHVVSLFEEQAAAHSIGFDIELAPDLPRFVVGDPTRLRQVLVNLVGNAFKFTQRGSVSVQVEALPADPARPNINMIRFSVKDTGIGIASDALGRLFQKFEQADSTTTRRYGGSGLGLAICRQLVELMGGTIGVESEEGAGSCFSFVLPLADGVRPPVVEPAPRAPHSHRLRVLCAEDFPTNQIIIRMMLQELGHQADIVDNGQLALAACARTRYDLILMDGRMPELDGASATRIIRAGGPPEAPVRDRDLMIIALTANASEEDRARYLASGMDDFLSKPIDEAALHDQLSRAIERQLARGVALATMPAAPAGAPGIADLDAMFGVLTGPTPLAVAVAQNAGRRTTDLKARLRSAFAGDLPGRRAQLEQALSDQDHDTAARVLHGLKGSAAYLDATELHLLCGELELAADQRQWGVIGAAMPRLRRLLDRFEDGAA
ncbi:two-component regulator propeller domain-containing protein [Massilia sp. R2A-15]|uniref:two-component regulator propeller domain-containing protein n=1 Tax=Massilia sp. R2A-15 TaxID=3064278 RepID=UPI0027322DD4|nr:two-component regulator propeller domain-containing protein [Massilia sp. R2A-15]WLI90223.1 two-component regulator propeller domain-containing protein [Massilia sp. R2A-15]